MLSELGGSPDFRVTSVSLVHYMAGNADICEYTTSNALDNYTADFCFICDDPAWRSTSAFTTRRRARRWKLGY